MLVLIAIASAQTGSAVARTIFDTAGAEGTTLLRLALAGLVLVAVVRPRPWRWSRASLGAAVLLGLTMAAMHLLFYLSIRTVPLGVAVTVEFIGPLLVALVQAQRLRELLWVGCAAAGVVLLGLDRGADVPLGGLALAFGAGLFWGAYIFASARVGRLIPGTDGLAIALVVGALVVLPFGAVGAARTSGEPAVLLTAFVVALLSSVIPFGAELAALRRMPTRVFGVLMSLEPAAGAIAGYVVLDQSLLARQLVALVLVSAASVGVTWGMREGQQPPQPLD